MDRRVEVAMKRAKFWTRAESRRFELEEERHNRRWGTICTCPAHNDLRRRKGGPENWSPADSREMAQAHEAADRRRERRLDWYRTRSPRRRRWARTVSG